MIPCDTHMIPVWSETQNNMENVRNKRYKIVCKEKVKQKMKNFENFIQVELQAL